MNEPNEHPESATTPSAPGRVPPPPAVPAAADPPDEGGPPEQPLDLDAVERDLDAVETALERLDDGTYWTDEVTGDEIADSVLADDPAARRAT